MFVECGCFLPETESLPLDTESKDVKETLLRAFYTGPLETKLEAAIQEIMNLRNEHKSPLEKEVAKALGKIHDELLIKRCPNPACGIKFDKHDYCGAIACSACQHHFCAACYMLFSPESSYPCHTHVRFCGEKRRLFPLHDSYDLSEEVVARLDHFRCMKAVHDFLDTVSNEDVRYQVIERSDVTQAFYTKSFGKWVPNRNELHAG